jgi:hypothetical protein
MGSGKPIAMTWLEVWHGNHYSVDQGEEVHPKLFSLRVSLSS